MINVKRYVLIVLMVMAFLPTVVSYYPVQATAMANVTASSNFSIRYNPTTSVWSQGTFNYVGCVNGSNDTKYGIGIRFENPNIPQGATINSAYLVVTSAGTYTQDTVNSIIQGEDIDTAVAFSTVANYQARTRTSSYVTWNGIPHWTSGSNYVSSDISTVISEIVGRVGWTAAVSDMVLFWDDHNAASSQGSYVPPIVRGGSSYTLVVDYTSATTVTIPSITTKEASDVGSTTAILNTFINDDGDDSVAVRFGYDTITHAGDFSLYGTIGTWSTSNYTTGESAYYVLTGLSPLTTYFFNVQGQNTAGTANGTEMQFVTPAAVTTLSPSSFIILPSSVSTDLQWTKPSGFSECKLYYGVGVIPSSNITGTLLYSGSNPYYTHSSLTSGTTYGYRVYGYENGVWSASTTGIITTKGTSTTAGLTTPTTPLDWFFNTDYQTQNQTFLFPIINNLADSFSMPRDTAWVTWALGLSMFLGFLVWSASRSMMMVVIAVCAGILLGVAQGLLPKAMVLLVVAFAIPIIAVRERI
jgi:hypothetical protein